MHFHQRTLFSLSLCVLVALFLPGRVAHADIDFNNDGLPDLLFQNQSTGQIVYWELDGATYLGGESVQSPLSADWQLRDSAALNADGKTDLIYQSLSTGQVVVWYMDGSTKVGGGALSLLPAPGYQVVGTGDFNADGHPDLVFQNSTTGQIAIWFLNGLTVIGGSTPSGLSSFVGPDTRVVGVADFNEDGYPDLVLQNRVSHVVSFVAMHGVQVAGGATLPWIPDAVYNVVGLGDFNGDGQPDLLFQNATTGQLTYWLLNHTTLLGWGNLPTPSSLDWKVAGARTFSALHSQTYLIRGVSYVTTAKHETLTAAFTQPDGGISLAGYQGYVRVHVTGVGQSDVPVHNDAFYLYDAQFSALPRNDWDGGYYQLAFSTTPLPTSNAGQSIVSRMVVPVPAYSPAHDYTILVNTGLSTPGQLHFGVSDGDFSDNTGSYTITVTQLALVPIVLNEIAFLGDSITQNGTYPTVVATAFNATATNDGIAGQRIAEMLARVDADVIARHPDLCIVFAGTNDAYFATPIAQVQSDYDTLLKKLKAANIPVVVVTPPHFAVGSSYENRDLNTSLAPVVAAIRAVAAMYELTVAEVYNDGIPLKADGEHPNAEGQAAIAKIVTAAIKSAVSTGHY